ncbi:MAG: DDE-type integrase/transposase/recombinase [Bacteroidales bacterium]
MKHEELSSRKLAFHIIDNHKWYKSESSVYRILKRAGLITSPTHIVTIADDEFETKTRRIDEMWQTDFTYFKIIGWGWYYLLTIIDDYSRFITTWDICSQMTSKDVMPSIEKALQFTGLKKENAPKLLSGNGSCYISKEIKGFLKGKGIKPINGKPLHPQTQGKIEKYHRTMKNVIKLDNYYSPEDLIKAIAEFVNYYNYKRYHESLRNLTPEDVYFGGDKKIL